MKLPSAIASVHMVFNVSKVKKYISDTVSVPPIEGLRVGLNLSYEEITVENLDRQVKKLTNKEVATVKVLLSNHLA